MLIRVPFFVCIYVNMHVYPRSRLKSDRYALLWGLCVLQGVDVNENLHHLGTKHAPVYLTAIV